MGFRIGFTKWLTLRCWHPDYLRSMAGNVPVAPTDTLSTTQRNDYLRYDVRNLLDIRPTAHGAALLKRYSFIWTPSTLGGWLLARDTYDETDPGVRLQLGVYLRDPGFAAATDFGMSSVEGWLFHLTNATSAVTAEHELTGGNLRSVHYLPSRDFTLTLPQLTPNTDSQVQLRDPLLTGNPILETIAVKAAAPSADEYRVEIMGRPPGLYRFTGSNITNQNILLGFTGDPTLIGVIDLRLADWDGAAFDLHFKPS
ncbi:hypothetical protein [Neolewinella litorea]|uniref:Uncharacterized protein n=1 Tax=Neolewinella litorea TaxID=2562452 RepID=A0A4S4NI56_9BACT|nr:hypothetical protein [Neolewinella litorea]THH39416.1 hypothetical protein E4021_11730 [Neolewinella litorea]